MSLSLPSFIPQTFLDSIVRHAERDYPHECCGLIFGPAGKKELSRIQAFKNAQNKYHAQDPGQFPRTAGQAYFIEPEELLRLQKELRRTQEEIRVIYHSHIDAPAYFSEEDKRLALFEGEPVYPGADYLVVSVMQGKARGAQLYRWDVLKKDYLQSHSFIP